MHVLKEPLTEDGDLQVVIATGPDDPKRVVLGLSMAASASAAGSLVRVYLVMDGAHWLRDDNCNRIAVSGYPSVSELMDMVREGGGTIEYCQNCVEARCNGSVDGQDACGCAATAGIAAYGMRMPTTPTVVF